MVQTVGQLSSAEISDDDANPVNARARRTKGLQEPTCYEIRYLRRTAFYEFGISFLRVVLA